MVGLWLNLKTSAKLVAWAAPYLHKWSQERESNRRQGEVQLQANNFAEAEEHLKEAVDEYVVPGTSPNNRVQLQLQLAEAQRQQGAEDPAKLDEAETTIRGALETTARVSNPSGYVQCLDALAEVYHDRGDLPAMRSLLEEGVRIEAAMPHPDPARMARRIRRLGLARHMQGEDGTAALAKAVEMHEQVHGEDHLETGDVLADAGIVYRARGLHEEAQRCLRRALRIHEREHGYDSAEAIRDLHSLAGSYEDAGDLDSASAAYERALDMQDRIVGGDKEELAEMYFGIAALYVDWGNFSRARELLASCIGTFRRKKGARLAVAYELVGFIEEYSGRYKDAVAELERAAKIWEACGPERAAELATNLEYRARLLDELKRTDSANWLREKAAATRASAAGAT